MNSACRILAAVAVVLLAAGGPSLAQQGGGGGRPGQGQGQPPPTNDCDMATKEPGNYCSKCDALLGKDDVDKDKKCKTCGEKVKPVQVCVKVHYVCGCGGGGCCTVDQLGSGQCKCKKDLQKKTEKARILYQCMSCMAQGATAAEVAHDKNCKDKSGSKVKARCSKNGVFPHSPPPKK